MQTIFHFQPSLSEFCQDCNADDNEADKAPTERIVIPADVIEINKADESVYVIGTKDGKVTKITGLDGMPNMKV